MMPGNLMEEFDYELDGTEYDLPDQGLPRYQTGGRVDDVIIAVMGSTGTGKSSFIKLLSGDASVVTSDGLESETSEIRDIRFVDRATGRNVIIVDTPGFDDSRPGVTDTDILKKITQFLLDVYDEKRKLNGLIYIHRISDPRFGGQSGRNLRMFQSLCGAGSFRNVVVLTTFWDKVTVSEGAKREQQLKANPQCFKKLADGDARFMRHDLTLRSAQDVLKHIFKLAPTDVEIQKEIRVDGKPLEKTKAGSVHSKEVEGIIAKHKEEMDELKGEIANVRQSNKELAEELQKERAELKDKLAKWEQERSELRQGLDDQKKTLQKMIEEKEAEKKAKEAEEREKEAQKKFVKRLREMGKTPATIAFHGGNRMFADMWFTTPLASVEVDGIEASTLDVDICYADQTLATGKMNVIKKPGLQAARSTSNVMKCQFRPWQNLSDFISQWVLTNNNIPVMLRIQMASLGVDEHVEIYTPVRGLGCKLVPRVRADVGPLILINGFSFVFTFNNPLDCRLTISDLELTAYIDGEEICTAKHSPGFSLEAKSRRQSPKIPANLESIHPKALYLINKYDMVDAHITSAAIKIGDFRLGDINITLDNIDFEVSISFFG